MTRLGRLYEETESCVAALREAGLATEAEQVERGLYGATSGEALEYIGAGLDALLRSDARLSPGLRRRAERILAEADAILRQAGQR